MLTKLSVLFVLLAVGTASAASAHAIVEEEAQASTVLPVLECVLIALSVLLYTAGVLRIRTEAGPERVVAKSQILAFAAAIVLFIVIISPLVDEVTDALFSAHMAQHLVLILFIPPLLVWSRPVLVAIWGLPPHWRKDFAISRGMRWLRSVVNWLMQPLLVGTLFLGVFCFWHLPRPYAWALSNEWLHTGEHLSFLVTAIMFWTLVIEPSGCRRMGYIPTMLFVAVLAVLSGLPGALMILSPEILFKAHGDASLAWGLTALQDQQIAGVIMWVPAGIFFLVPIAWLFVKALEPPEHRRVIRQVASLVLMVALVPALLTGCTRASSKADGASQKMLGHAKALIGKYGCGTCHTIPGIDNANGRVGPPLSGIADRVFIAGALQNNTDNLTKWISDPQSVVPGTAMPAIGIKPKEARTIATYLQTLHDEK
jgi:cytochrome c oxidase assembly factor CtaG/cytochrome c2